MEGGPQDQHCHAPSGTETEKLEVRRRHRRLTYSLTHLPRADERIGRGGGCIVEAVSPLCRPLWAKRLLSLEGRTAHVIQALIVARVRTLAGK